MGLFPALAIIIVVVVIIIIVVVVAIWATSGTKNNPSDGTCSNQNNCTSGYVCIHDSSTNSNKCKAGLGTSCSNDSDCVPELICSATGGSSNKVCSRRDDSTTRLSSQRPKVNNQSISLGVQRRNIPRAKRINIDTSSQPTPQQVTYQTAPSNNNQESMLIRGNIKSSHGLGTLSHTPLSDDDYTINEIKGLDEIQSVPVIHPESVISDNTQLLKSQIKHGEYGHIATRESLMHEQASFGPLIAQPSQLLGESLITVMNDNRNHITHRGRRIDPGSHTPLSHDYYGTTNVPISVTPRHDPKTPRGSRVANPTTIPSTIINLQPQTHISSLNPSNQSNISFLNPSNQSNMSSIGQSNQSNMSSIGQLNQSNMSSISQLNQPNMASVGQLNQSNMASIGQLNQPNMASVGQLDQNHEMNGVNVPPNNGAETIIRKPTRRSIVRRGKDDVVTPITGLQTDNTPVIQTYIPSGTLSIKDPTEVSIQAPVIEGATANIRRTGFTSKSIIRTNEGQIMRKMDNTNLLRKPRNMINDSVGVYDDVTSLDDEVNSDGTYTNEGFDIRSGHSTDNRGGTDVITSVSTPCEERNGVYYCRNDKSDVIDHITDGDYRHSAVIDVCSYSNATLFLLEDGNIIREIIDEESDLLKRQSDDIRDEKKSLRQRATNNVKLIRITSFDGYLYGVGIDNKLYTLPNSHFLTCNWLWNLAEWAPTDIKHISSTHDFSHLWIQTNTLGYLYSNPSNLVSKTPYMNLKRVYGRDVQHYIDIDAKNYTATTHPDGTIVYNVYNAALSYYDEVVAIHPADHNEYRGITIVNWRPYYIRA